MIKDFPNTLPSNFRLIFRLFKGTIKAFIKNDLFTYGAALAYYTIFSVAPGLIVIIFIGSYFVSGEEANLKIATELKDAFGLETTEMIMRWIENIKTYRNSGWKTLILILTFFFGATGAFVQLSNAFNKIWARPPKTKGILLFFKNRLLSLSILVLIGFLLVAALLFDTILVILTNQLSEFLSNTQWIMFLANRIGVFTLFVFLFFWVFKVLPNLSLKWNDVLPGAIMTAFLFSVSKWMFANFIGYSNLSIYGTASSLIGLLIWIFITSQIIFFGAVFNKTLAENRSYFVKGVFSLKSKEDGSSIEDRDEEEKEASID